MDLKSHILAMPHLPHDMLNPLMPKSAFCTSIKFIAFKKQMLQSASSDLFNPLVPKAHNSECQNILFHLQIKPYEYEVS